MLKQNVRQVSPVPNAVDTAVACSSNCFSPAVINSTFAVPSLSTSSITTSNVARRQVCSSSLSEPATIVVPEHHSGPVIVAPETKQNPGPVILPNRADMVCGDGVWPVYRNNEPSSVFYKDTGQIPQYMELGRLNCATGGDLDEMQILYNDENGNSHSMSTLIPPTSSYYEQNISGPIQCSYPAFVRHMPPSGYDFFHRTLPVNAHSYRAGFQQFVGDATNSIPSGNSVVTYHPYNIVPVSSAITSSSVLCLSQRGVVDPARMTYHAYNGVPVSSAKISSSVLSSPTGGMVNAPHMTYHRYNSVLVSFDTTGSSALCPPPHGMVGPPYNSVPVASALNSSSVLYPSPRGMVDHPYDSVPVASALNSSSVLYPSPHGMVGPPYNSVPVASALEQFFCTVSTSTWHGRSSIQQCSSCLCSEQFFCTVSISTWHGRSSIRQCSSLPLL